MPGGAVCFSASRTTAGSGAPADDNATYPSIEIMLDQFDDGASGGGRIYAAGTDGGL